MMNINTKNENEKSWISFYKSSFNEYLELWNNPELRVSCEISADATAFYLLESAEMIWRYSGNEKIKKTIKNLSSDKRKYLFSEACKYIAESNLPNQSLKVTQLDALSDDKLDQAENIILLRDGLQAVLEILKYMAKDLLMEDKEMLSDLTNAFYVAAEVDDSFLERPDIASVASRIMEPFREMVKVDAVSDNYWWFEKARKWDEIENKIFSDSKLLAENLGIPRAALVKAPIISKLQKVLISLTDTTKTGTNKLKTIAGNLKLAGEDKIAAYGLVVSNIPDFINQFSGQNELASAGLQARSLDKKTHTNRDFKKTKPKVRTLISPKQNPKNLEKTIAKWSVIFDDENVIEDCPALVINIETGKVIGVAEFITEEQKAVLIDGLWKDFEPVADSLDSIMLLFVSNND